MIAATTPRPRVGREAGRLAIARVLASAQEGVSSTLVLRGAAGVGKTALLEDALASVAQVSVHRLAGVEAEMGFGFSGLHQLLGPFVDAADALPLPQRRALHAAFGLDDIRSPDRFLVALAALTLFSAEATRHTVLIVVDDAQWLDAETANVLEFLARRLRGDRVGLLIAMGDRGSAQPALDGLPSLMLGANIRTRVLADHRVPCAADRCAGTIREQGATEPPSEGLFALGLRGLRVGSLAEAEARFTEQRHTADPGQRMDVACEVGLLMVSAWRGIRDVELHAARAALTNVARRFERGREINYIAYAVALHELGFGNYAAASAATLTGIQDDPALGVLGAADAVEAHARSGACEVARAMVGSMSERAIANGGDHDLGLLARSRALLLDDSKAEECFHESIVRLASSGGHLHVARSQLLYGEWLRRQMRRRDARAQLQAACETFELEGARGFAERARVELLATGASARKRVDETRNDLTPREGQIARLAAAGATNSEIGARLFISANTVDYHLRKVYRKVDVKSRRELVGRTFTP